MPRPARCVSSMPRITARRPLRFFAYAWGEVERRCRPTTQMGMIEAFARFGLPVNPLTMPVPRREEMLAHYRDIEAQRATLGYDIDGVVYKVDDLALAEAARLCLARAALGGGA